MSRAVLVLGAGNDPKQKVRVLDPLKPGVNEGECFTQNFDDVWTIDQDPHAKPRIVWDLESFSRYGDDMELSWPVHENFFDEVHAYEVLEHLGAMGDFKFFFALWRKIWRVLKKDGVVCATTPWWQSVWAWQDPGHRRVYSPEILIYLSQDQYEAQIGRTAMTDYRRFWPKPYDFEVNLKKGHESWRMVGENPLSAGFLFVLKKKGGEDIESSN